MLASSPSCCLLPVALHGRLQCSHRVLNPFRIKEGRPKLFQTPDSNITYKMCTRTMFILPFFLPSITPPSAKISKLLVLPPFLPSVLFPHLTTFFFLILPVILPLSFHHPVSYLPSSLFILPPSSVLVFLFSYPLPFLKSFHLSTLNCHSSPFSSFHPYFIHLSISFYPYFPSFLSYPSLPCIF